MEPALYRLGLMPREVERLLREETVADVRAMVDGSAWRLAWETTYAMNATGNYKEPIEVAQIHGLLLRDLLTPPDEPEQANVDSNESTEEQDARRARTLDRLHAAQLKRLGHIRGVEIIGQDGDNPSSGESS